LEKNLDVERPIDLNQSRRRKTSKTVADTQDQDRFDAKRGRGTQTNSFESLGLHPPIVTALRTAFPNIKHPTKSQEELIPAVLAGQDIFLQDQTGSGK
jgi:superfamily II DNA/RNA helicase